MENQARITPTDKSPLSFAELWLLALLSRLVDENDGDYVPYRLVLRDMGLYKSADIGEICSTLLNRSVKLTSLDSIFETHLINSFEWLKGDEPTLLFTIHPKLKPYLASFLMDSKGLLALDTDFLLLGVPQRIFCILIFTMMKGQTTYFFDLEKLKGFLGVSDKYSLYANFKIKILEETRKKVEAEIGLHFDYDEVKKGKKVAAIRFRLHQTLPQSFFENDESDVELPPSVQTTQNEVSNENGLPKTLLLEQLKPIVCKKFGVTLKMLKILIEDFPIETLRQAVVLTEKAIESGKIKGSPAGFFVEATRQNYQPLGSTPSVNDDAERKRQAEARQKAQERAQIEAQQQKERAALKKQEFEQERDAILAELNSDSNLRNTIIERIRYSLFYLSYDADKTFEENLANPSFLAAVLNFAKIVKAE